MSSEGDMKASDVTVVLSGKDIQALGIARAALPDKDEVTQAMLVDDAHVALAKGTRLSEFEITGVIGQGGFGIVYEARDASLEREVAIKEYLPSSLAMRNANGHVVPRSTQHQESFDLGLKSFVNEARLLAQFDHPSLLKVYRFWDERGTTYMVMPLYKGLTFKQVLAKKEVVVDEPWLTHLLDGVTQALALIHSADCYHRDIAPDNIMLVGQDHHPVVLDFGAARRVISGMTQALTVILKPGYAPVEQYADSPDFKQGPWTDIYALGAVMYGAIANKPPPPSVTRLLTDSYKRLVDDTELRSRYSERFLAAIDAALAVRPEDRPQSMGAFRSLLGLSDVAQVSNHGNAQTVLRSHKSTPMLKSDIKSGQSNEPNEPSRLARRTVPLAIAFVCAGILVFVGYGFLAKPSKTTALASSVSLPSAQVLPAVKPSVENLALTPALVFEGIQNAASADFKVAATVKSATVKIANKEKLEFSIQSANAGYLFVYLLSSGGEMLQLFPNQLDKRNRIKAGETIKLPRASWPMEAGGPVGTNRFVAVVSSTERDFSNAGLINDGVFGRYSMDLVSALERAKTAGSQPIVLGKSNCATGGACDTNFGAASFSISEE
jgi:serine/threonine protein kinase